MEPVLLRLSDLRGHSVYVTDNNDNSVNNNIVLIKKNNIMLSDNIVK